LSQYPARILAFCFVGNYKFDSISGSLFLSMERRVEFVKNCELADIWLNLAGLTEKLAELSMKLAG
jgi:hypothetical protein